MEPNEELDEMQADRENRLVKESGKEALKKRQKKDDRKQTIKILRKDIIEKIKLVLIIALGFIVGAMILVSIITSIFGGSIEDNPYFSDKTQAVTRSLSLQEYLRQFSHSGEAPQSENGRFYKMYGDGVGWPTIGTADLQWKSHQYKFDCSGKVLTSSGEQTVENVREYVNTFLTSGSTAKYTDEEIDAMGIYIEKELVDSVGETVAENYYQLVVDDTELLELSQQQKYALTAIAYNFGFLPKRNGYTFVDVYEEGAGLYQVNSWEHMKYIWDNWWCYIGGGSPGHIPARDAAFETFVKGIYDFTESEAGEVFGRQHYIYYTQEQLDWLQENDLDEANGERVPNKPITRTPGNEQEIFTYELGINNSVVAGDLLSAAEVIHKKYEDEDWTYSVNTNLLLSNIKDSINNPNKVTCCATFVSSALYLSGLLSEEEVNSFGYHSSNATYNYLKSLEGRFMEITSYDDLQAGDIVYMTSDSVPSGIGHTQIYAGDGTWYNAGSTERIQQDSPYSSNPKNRFITAIRPL